MPQLAAQQAVPTSELVPTKPILQSGSDPSGEDEGDGVGEVITQGGIFVKHEPALRLIRGIQQPSTPPTLVPQSEPPQTRQDAKQQTDPNLRSAIMPSEQVGSFVRGDGEEVGVRTGVLEGVGDGETIMQGGKLLSHLTFESRILLMQQLVTPPGSSAHIGPPHMPQDFVQQTDFPLRVLLIPVIQFGSADNGEGVGVFGADGDGDAGTGVPGSLHGGLATVQNGLFFKIEPTQHSEAPPLRVPHRLPPHFLQDFEQQAKPSEFLPTIPVEHVGSVPVGGGGGDVTVGGRLVAGGLVAGRADKTHGGALVVHRTLRLIMRPTQQEIAPPGRLEHVDPPHTPHVLGQHTAVVPTLLTAMIPVEQVGSASAGDGDNCGMTHGGALKRQSLLASRILVTQQLAPMPSMLQSGPPQTAHVALQQAFP